MSLPRIVYDVGSNNGDNIPYYLMKADVVVAIEANPDLCSLIRRKYADEVANGRLRLENCVVTVDNEGLGEIDFYIHNSNHVLSQLPPPDSDVLAQFTKVKLPSRSIIEIIKQYGDPHYVKVDIEHFDAYLLRSLFENGIRPPFISAESHSIEIFCLLVSEGRYDSFKLVDGSSVSTRYRNRQIKNELTGGYVHYSFPGHSAGPFGEDIDGDWMTADNFFRLLAFEELGWKDIHATSRHSANPLFAPSFREYFKRYLRNGIKYRLRTFAFRKP